MHLVVDAGECSQALRSHLQVECKLLEMEVEAASTWRPGASPGGQRLWASGMARERQGQDCDQLRGAGKEVPVPKLSEIVQGRVAPAATHNYIRIKQRCCGAEGAAAVILDLKFLPQSLNV